MYRVAILYVLFAVVGYTEAEVVKMPASCTVQVGRLGTLQMSSAGKAIKWVCVDPDLDIFREWTEEKQTVQLRFRTDRPGTYRIVAYTAVGDVPSEPAVCVITAVGPEPPVPPGPVPPGPTPVPSGLRVLIVYESEEVSKYPAPLQSVIYGKEVRDYLDAKCVQDPDLKRKAWNVWDQHADVRYTSKPWQDLMGSKRDSLPWIQIQSGTQLYSGPLPASVPATLELLTKYGGK